MVIRQNRELSMNLTDRTSHFEFGENWRDYAKIIDQQRIDSAVAGVKKLFPEGLEGKKFLDIGSGSGLHSLAALLLGANSVLAVDIDENSVGTTRELLEKFAVGKDWDTRVLSVFDTSPESLGQFDVVYSWGALHHTGDMWRAIEMAAKLVKRGGLFALAIYSKTVLDPFWKAEKRIYSILPRPAQWLACTIYMGAFLTAKMAIQQVNPISYVRAYSRTRGMNFSHDAHDWLGGYPYETATANEMGERISKMGFNEVRSIRQKKGLGIFGSVCHEFVFRSI